MKESKANYTQDTIKKIRSSLKALKNSEESARLEILQDTADLSYSAWLLGVASLQSAKQFSESASLINFIVDGLWAILATLDSSMSVLPQSKLQKVMDQAKEIVENSPNQVQLRPMYLMPLGVCFAAKKGTLTRNANERQLSTQQSLYIENYIRIQLEHNMDLQFLLRQSIEIAEYHYNGHDGDRGKYARDVIQSLVNLLSYFDNTLNR